MSQEMTPYFHSNMIDMDKNSLGVDLQNLLFHSLYAFSLVIKGTKMVQGIKSLF